jgi:hypothetical protein
MNQPRRQQAKQSPVRNTSFSLSPNHNSVGVLESSLEKDYFLWRRYELGEETLLEMQPPKIQYDNAKGKPTTYTADGAIIENEIYYIDEVKYLEESLTEENQIKFKILEKLFAKKSKVFRVVTEVDIRVGHRMDNIKQLYPSKLHPAPVQQFETLIKGIRFKHLYMKDAIALNKKRKLPFWVIRRSIAHGLFQTDITKHMSALELTWS